ncbi:unnamed protein product [Brassica oleracea]
MRWLCSFFSPLKKLWVRVNSAQKKSMLSFIYGMFMLKDETNEKLVSDMIHIYVFSHLYIII